MSRNPRGQTLPIHQAAQRGDLDAVLAELAGGAAIDAPGSEGNHPLHLAVTAGNVLLVRRLLALGAKPNGRNRQGLTPLHLAARMGAIDIAQALLAERARIDARGSLHFVVQQFPTPLLLAIEAGQPAMAEWLLQHGADPNLLCSTSGETALGMAARQGDANLVRILLLHGAHPDGVDGSGGAAPHERPLEAAGSGAVARLLLAAGARVNVANADGEWPLHWLAAAHDRDRARLAALAWVLRAGAEPLARDAHGRTPLQRVRSPVAMRWLRLAIERQLRRCPWIGIEVSIQAGRALLSLCELGSEAVLLAQLELLQLPQVNVSSRDQNGCTALQVLQRRQHGSGLGRDEARLLQRLIARLQWLEKGSTAQT